MIKSIPAHLLAALLALGALLPSSAIAESACPGALAVPMKLERTGNVTVTLDVLGTPVRFAVDSGANGNVLDAVSAQKMGAAITPSAGLPLGQGHASAPVTVAGVALGNQSFGVFDLDFINSRVGAYGTEPFGGQLGVPFFTETHASIDFEHMVMCVQPTVPPPACANGSIPMEREKSGHISVRTHVKGIPERMLVDTGTNVNTLDIEVADGLDALVERTTDDKLVKGYTRLDIVVGGRSLGDQPFTVMNLAFINIAPKRQGAEPFAGMLGADFFREHRVKIDFDRMQMCMSASPAR